MVDVELSGGGAGVGEIVDVVGIVVVVVLVTLVVGASGLATALIALVNTASVPQVWTLSPGIQLTADRETAPE